MKPNEKYSMSTSLDDFDENLSVPIDQWSDLTYTALSLLD